MERVAVCSCGQLSVTIEGEPVHHGLCSCLECQKASGGPFTYTGDWPKSAVKRIAGAYTTWRRTSDLGRWLENCFCPTCGSHVFGYFEQGSDAISVSIGNFAEPAFPPPTYAIWNRFKHPWVAIDPAWRSFDRQPDAGDATAGEPHS